VLGGHGANFDGVVGDEAGADRKVGVSVDGAIELCKSKEVF